MSNLYYLNEHKNFNNTNELNEAVNDHITNNNHELNTTDRDVIMMLSQYSVKYKGVAHLRVNTIANFIDKSRRTVQTSLRKLERLNIIKIEAFMREVSGGNGANLYIILPYDCAPYVARREVVEEVEQPSDETDNNENETILSLSNKSSNTLLDTQTNSDVITSNEVIKRGLRHSIPTDIYNALEPFYDGQGLYNTYGILLRAKASINRNITLEEYASDYMDAFYNVIRLFKAGKVRSLDGILYRTWEKVTAEISRCINYNNSDNVSSTLRLFSEVMHA